MKAKIPKQRKGQKFSVVTFLILIVASLINSVGVGLLLIPAQIIDGGNSGFSYLISVITKWNVSIFLIVLNFPFYFIAFKKLGLSSVVYALFSISMYSLFMYLLRTVFQLCGPDGNDSPFTNNQLLCSLFGGLLSGIGSGLTIRMGSSLDGIEVMATMLTKKLGVSVGKIVMTFNVAMYLLAGLLLKGWEIPMYSIIAYTIGVKVVDAIVEGLDKAKASIIITEKGNLIAAAISERMGSGITIIRGKGFYSDNEKTVLYYVINKFEIVKLKKLISSIDDKAFVSIIDVTDVFGTEVKNNYGNLLPNTLIAKNKNINKHKYLRKKNKEVKDKVANITDKNTPD